VRSFRIYASCAHTKKKKKIRKEETKKKEEERRGESVSIAA
jgi:hypothetical protein